MLFLVCGGHFGNLIGVKFTYFEIFHHFLPIWYLIYMPKTTVSMP